MAANRTASARPGLAGLAVLLLAALAMAVVATTALAGGGVSAGGGGNGSSARYTKVWDRFNRHDRTWAHKTSKCESGQNPRAIGGNGRYRGAFQFTRPTWKSAPKSPSGDPIRYSWTTQAVVAVLLKHREGTKPWPVCG